MRIPDAEENLERARAMIESVRGDTEIYHRASLRRRVTVCEPHAAPEIQEVMEEGTAVRVRSSGRVGFAATSGAETELPWALTRALENATRDASGHPAWANGEGSPLEDRTSSKPPEIEDLAGWLPRMGGGGWVEAALTIETLATSDGLLASRARTRAWAMALRRSTPEGREQPRTIHGRGLDDLDPSEWQEEPPISSRQVPAPGAPAVFRGEAARALVLGLARALHGEDSTGGMAVGRGYCLRDDPLHPRAIAGGTFDDCGFPAESVLLADGITTLRGIAGPGHLRRASYRDWPEATPACLTVFAENAPFPENATHIVDARIHAFPNGWVVDCDGFVLRTSPVEVVRRIVATAGPARSYGTVVTPALVLEGLRFE